MTISVVENPSASQLLHVIERTVADVGTAIIEILEPMREQLDVFFYFSHMFGRFHPRWSPPHGSGITRHRVAVHRAIHRWWTPTIYVLPGRSGVPP